MKISSESPFVFLPNVVLLTEINQVCDGLGRQKLKSIDNIDLGMLSAYTHRRRHVIGRRAAHVVQKIITYNELVRSS